MYYPIIRHSANSPNSDNAIMWCLTLVAPTSLRHHCRAGEWSQSVCAWAYLSFVNWYRLKSLSGLAFVVVVVVARILVLCNVLSVRLGAAGDAPKEGCPGGPQEQHDCALGFKTHTGSWDIRCVTDFCFVIFTVNATAKRSQYAQIKYLWLLRISWLLLLAGVRKKQ